MQDLKYKSTISLYRTGTEKILENIFLYRFENFNEKECFY